MDIAIFFLVAFSGLGVIRWAQDRFDLEPNEYGLLGVFWMIVSGAILIGL